MKLRPATDADRGYFFYLRNTATPVYHATWQQHYEWWEANTDAQFVAEDVEGRAVATARLSPKGEISLIVDPLARGLAFGQLIVKTLVKHYGGKFARVRADNPASLICFIKAGLRPVRIENGMVYLEA